MFGKARASSLRDLAGGAVTGFNELRPRSTFPLADRCASETDHHALASSAKLTPPVGHARGRPPGSSDSFGPVLARVAAVGPSPCSSAKSVRSGSCRWRQVPRTRRYRGSGRSHPRAMLDSSCKCSGRLRRPRSRSRSRDCDLRVSGGLCDTASGFASPVCRGDWPLPDLLRAEVSAWLSGAIYPTARRQRNDPRGLGHAAVIGGAG